MTRQEPRFEVYLGLDVGKETHHACALDPDGKRVHDKPLPQDETRLRELFTTLGARGPVLVVVDQPASIGALPVTVAQDMGVTVAYLPGLAMRRIADLHPGNAKTDPRDAWVVAEAARTLPGTLRAVGTDDQTMADLRVVIGWDDDLAEQATRLTNRIRGLLTQVHPALEHVLGPRLATNAGARRLLIRYGGPARLKAAGREQLLEAAKTKGSRTHTRLVHDVLTALDAQSVTVPGTTAATTVLKHLADDLDRLVAQRKEAAEQIEKALDAHPLAKVLTSMPGVGVRTGARILLEVGDASAFPTAGHLAAYAGLAPVTRRSGTSIRGEHPPRGGNKKLKRALFLAAFAALQDPTSRTYYDRKRAQGKRHNAALVCLARRRIDVLHAMLRNGTLYQHPSPDITQAAA